MSGENSLPEPDPPPEIQPAPLHAMPERGHNNVFFRVCPDSDAVIVFIHGILSDSRSCWLRDSSRKETYWPALICTDPLLNGISIFLAGYRTSIDAGESGIREAASKVMNELRFQRDFEPVLKYKKIVFACHSTGGIVARYLLSDNLDQFQDKTVGLVLIASPSLGSPFANRIAFVSKWFKYKLAQQLMIGDWSLEDLNDRFKKIKERNKLPRLFGVEGYEQRPIFYNPIIPGIWKIVTKRSAAVFFDRELLEDTDHFTAAKPVSLTDAPHSILVRFLRDQMNLALNAAPVGRVTYPHNSTPVPLPPIRKPRKRRLVTASVGLSLLALAAAIWTWHPTKPWVTIWKFELHQNQLDWRLPDGWSISHDARNPQLVINGPTSLVGGPKDFDRKPLSDFILRFRVSLDRDTQPGTKLVWSVRTHPNAAPATLCGLPVWFVNAYLAHSLAPAEPGGSQQVGAYQFKLDSDSTHLRLISSVIRAPCSPDQLPIGEHDLGLDCCRTDVELYVELRVRGKRFDHCISLQNPNSFEDTSQIGQVVSASFLAAGNLYPSGSFGFAAGKAGPVTIHRLSVEPLSSGPGPLDPRVASWRNYQEEFQCPGS